MEIETLKRSHLKRNILIAVVVVLIISAIILQFTRAKYRVTESIPLVNGVINYTPYDFKIIAMYQQNESGEYAEIDEMPSSGYVINESESYCTLDNESKDSNVKLYTNSNWEHVMSGLKKNSKCYLFFDELKLMDFPERLYEDNQDILAYDGTTDNNLRYIGADPDNYVYFNCDDYTSPTSDTCELWRIIGVMNNMETADGNQSLVKLIRDASFSEYWDTDTSNNWSSASLQETLNGDYLNRTEDYSSTGITSTTRNMIETVIWKLGGVSSSGNTASEFYIAERGQPNGKGK